MTKPQRVIGLFLVGASLAFGGCVSQQEYDDVAETNLTYQSRIEELHQENQSLRAMNDRKQDRVMALEQEVAQLRSVREDLNMDLDRIRDRQAQIRERLGNLRVAALNPALDRRLRELAANNPNLIAYDPDQSMIRFTSDLTFPSGSAQVNESAKPAIETLAEIMNSVDASEYEVHVVGHTDSQKISNPATLRRHPTNRHLSVHRAISVSEALQSFGVEAERVLVAGWGSMRPAVPNRARGGTPENRRVEIYLMPATDFSSGGSTPSEATTSAPTEDRFPMK